MNTATFPRLFPAADAGCITLPAAVQEARRAYDRICTEVYPAPETHYDVLDRLVTDTVKAVQAGTPLPDCAAVDDARRAEQVATDQAEVLRMAVETLAAQIRASVDAGEVMTRHLQPHTPRWSSNCVRRWAWSPSTTTPGRVCCSPVPRSAPPRPASTAWWSATPRSARHAPTSTSPARTPLRWTSTESSARYATPRTCGRGRSTATSTRPRRRGRGPRPARGWRGSSPTGARLAWFIAHGCEVWLPTPTQQDERFAAVYAEQIEAAEHQRHMGSAIGVG